MQGLATSGFSAPPGSRRTARKPRTSSESLSSCVARTQAISSEYFSTRVLPTAVKLRLPEGELCSVRKIINDDLSSIRMLVANLISGASDVPASTALCYNLQLLGIKARKRDMSGLSQAALTTASSFPNVLLVKIYGLLASWASGQTDKEDQFFADILSTSYFPEDLASIVRLFDELRCVTPFATHPHRCSLRLIFDQVPRPLDSRRKPRDFPEPPLVERRLIAYAKHCRYGPDTFRLAKRHRAEVRLSRLMMIRSNAERGAPEMDIIREGFTADLENTSDSVASLMRQSKYAAAAAVASSALEQNPRNNEMLFHRAMALFKMEKYEDAIADCSSLVRILSTYGVRQFRAGLWELVGQRQYADEDMERQAS